MFDMLGMFGSKPDPEPATKYMGDLYEFDGLTYQLICMQENFLGMWFAILPDEKGVYKMPAQLWAIPHKPTRRWMEDKFETDCRKSILRELSTGAGRGPAERTAEACSGECALSGRHSFVLARADGVDTWPPLTSVLCSTHQGALEEWLVQNPTRRIPNDPSEPREVGLEDNAST